MGEITIVGLGPGSLGLITLDAWDKLSRTEHLLLRTAKHPTAWELEERGLHFTAYDAVYEEQETFARVYAAIAEDVVERAKRGDTLVYAVPGSPLVAEKTVALIRERARSEGVPVEILPGMSFLEVLCARLGIDPIDGLTVLDGADLERLTPDPAAAAVVTQVYSRRVASEVKLYLMEIYPDDHPIVLVRNLGLPDEELLQLPLYALDRQEQIDHLTSVYVTPLTSGARRFDLAPLTDVMARLRSPGGCVWDIEQTHASLRRNLIEEVYEVIEAIDLENASLLCEELGDLLLQVVFHARMAEEAGHFSMQEVVDGITEKLIRRHPHVFGDVTVRDVGEVVLNWEAIKRREKGKERPSVLDGVPKDLPALMRAYKLQHKAAKIGFDWDNISFVWDKIREEIAELDAAVAAGDAKEIEAELGDCLFTFVNLSRFLGVDAEVALNAANGKFTRRFSHVEQMVRKQGRQWEDMTLKEMDLLWDEAKRLNG